MNNLTNLQKKEITEVLRKLDFDEKEEKVYLRLLEVGSSTLTPLSRALQMPLTTVQAVLTRLYEQGAINITKKKSRRIYDSLDPVVLKKILQNRMEEVSNIIPFLQKIRKDDFTKSKINIYYRERATDIFISALECKNKLIYEIVSGKHLQQVLGEKIHFTRRRVRNGIRLKSLRIQEHEIKKYNEKIHRRELREAKFLSAELNFKASMMLWDNKVAFFSTKGEGIAWVVESLVIRDMTKQLFDLLWSVSKKMETI